MTLEHPAPYRKKPFLVMAKLEYLDAPGSSTWMPLRCAISYVVYLLISVTDVRKIGVLYRVKNF